MELCDVIKFNIDGKIRKIELYLGDITKLALTEKVDLLLVSAFPSNYSPVVGTLIHALKTEFNLSVAQLAKNKLEDLRANFHCWISQILPENLPYKRILCFEEGKNKSNQTYLENPVVLVGAVFRALFTAVRDKEWSMITPILSTGNQGSNKKIMIRAMVKACASWITAGMPLETMKIVIYKGVNDHHKIAQCDQEAIDEFCKLKSEINWMPSTNKIVEIEYDILFLYLDQDAETVKLFIDAFNKPSQETKPIYKTICIKEDSDKENETDFQIEMLKSKKTVMFITPALLETTEAIELYNLSLCLSLKTHRKILIPIYLKHIENMPEYMTLNQWIDFRLKETEKFENKLILVSNLLLEILKEYEQSKIILEHENIGKAKSNVSNQDIDVFISYCHKDSDIVHDIVPFFQITLPEVKIFFDKSGIKSGYSWQETLYWGINNTKILLALLSENYFNSPMCMEEFSLALSQHQSPKFSTSLIPVWISTTPIDKILENNSYIKYFFLVQNILVPKFEAVTDLTLTIKQISVFKELYNLYIGPILSKKISQKLSTIMEPIELEEAALKGRKMFFDSVWKLDQSSFTSPIIDKSLMTNYEKSEIDIVIGFHEDDLIVADILKKYILEVRKDLKIKFSAIGLQSEQSTSMTDFEKAHLVIILLNPYYISTNSCLNQLQIALSLHRRHSANICRLCPLILETLPSQPSFIHLLPNRFKADDVMFEDIIHKHKNSDNLIKNIINKYRGYPNEKSLTSKMEIMLYFAALWIGNCVFHKENFLELMTPVIYSTYDLIKTNYGKQKLQFSNIPNNQIKRLTVSKDSLNFAKEFVVKHLNIDVVESKIDCHSSPNQQNKIIDNDGSTVSEPFIKTKICVLQ